MRRDGDEELDEVEVTTGKCQRRPGRRAVGRGSSHFPKGRPGAATPPESPPTLGAARGSAPAESRRAPVTSARKRASTCRYCASPGASIVRRPFFFWCLPAVAVAVAAAAAPAGLHPLLRLLSGEEMADRLVPSVPAFTLTRTTTTRAMANAARRDTAATRFAHSL